MIVGLKRVDFDVILNVYVDIKECLFEQTTIQELASSSLALRIAMQFILASILIYNHMLGFKIKINLHD